MENGAIYTQTESYNIFFWKEKGAKEREMRHPCTNHLIFDDFAELLQEFRLLFGVSKRMRVLDAIAALQDRQHCSKVTIQSILRVGGAGNKAKRLILRKLREVGAKLRKRKRFAHEKKQEKHKLGGVTFRGLAMSRHARAMQVCELSDVTLGTLWYAYLTERRRRVD